MPSFCQNCIPRAGLVLQQGAILALDTIFLAGKIFPTSIPAYITQSALFGLSCCSIIGFPYQVTLISKTCTDFLHSKLTHEKTVVVATAIKALYVAVGIVLNGGNLLAATTGLFGDADLQSTLYNVMIPVGEGMIVVGITLTLSYLYFFYKVLKREEDIETALSFLQVESLEEEDLPEEIIQLASQVRHCMDKDTLADMITHFTSEQGSEFAEQAINNIKTQRNIALGGGILLSMLGYLLMAVEKYYTPNSVQAAVINEVMALFYTFDYTLRLGCEVCQRNTIATINVST